MEANANPDTIKQYYFDWLCSIINRRGADSEYRELAKALQEQVFYGKVPNDDNRAADGMKLRECFSLENQGNDTYVYLYGPCTMLEMLIGLAKRMDYILQEAGSEDQTAKWFWTLVENIGLETFSCDDPKADNKRKINAHILHRLLEREYQPSGRGGLFPLKHPEYDQRQVELWYQMQAWINENY